MKRNHIVLGVYSVLVLVLLAIFNPVSILAIPNVTGAEYLASIPFTEMTFFGVDFIFIKPSSSVLVYLLGLITVVIGSLFMKGSLARKHWGIALMLWGIGALLAGTSYQGFGYELKCTQYEFCSFTSWWELSYLYVTGLSITLMAVSVLMKMKVDKLKIPLIGFGLYSVLLLTGTVFEVRFLITYEMFLLFFMPYFLVLFVLNIIGYKKNGEKYHLRLIQVWILLLLINILYFIYLLLDVGAVLMDHFSMWFSANDLLHVTLIGWMIYIYMTLKDEV